MTDRRDIEPWASAVVPPEEPLAADSRSTPRSRLDDYRLELQRLQDDLEERQSAWKLSKGLARVLLKEPFFKLTGRYHREVHKDDHLLLTGGFKPYQVNYRKPPAASPRPVVVHIAGNAAVGGLSRLWLDIIEWTSDEYSHIVITPHCPAPQAIVGVNILELGLKTSLQKFTRVIRSAKPALVHVHHCAPHSLYSAWQWYRTAVMAAAETGAPVVEGVNVPMTPYCHPAVRAYVFVSNYVRDTFGFQNCPNHVIYPGSDFSLFAPQPKKFSDTIGMVYRLDESKLRRESIQVFIRVLQWRPSAKALIVGDGCLLPHFKAEVKKAGLADRFLFPGYVAYERLPEFYRQMDVFVAPVFCESFGQVTPFAMNMGIPVAAYATGALPEILHDPTIVAPAGDSAGLAEIIVALLADPQRRGETAGCNQSRAAAHFSVGTMVSHYSKLYGTLVAKPGP